MPPCPAAACPSHCSGRDGPRATLGGVEVLVFLLGVGIARMLRCFEVRACGVPAGKGLRGVHVQLALGGAGDLAGGEDGRSLCCSRLDGLLLHVDPRLEDWLGIQHL